MQTSPPDDPPYANRPAAVEIRDFLHELLFRFEGHYFGQIRRHQEQQRQDRIKPNNVGTFDADVPF